MALGGYCSSLEDTPEIYISRDDLRGYNDIPAACTKVIISLCLLCLIPLKWNLIRESIRSLFETKTIPKKIDIPLTIITMIVFNLLVYFTNIMTIIGFIGGIITVVISFLVPVFDYYHAFQDKHYSYLMILSFVILGVFTVVGFIASIQSVVNFIKDKTK